MLSKSQAGARSNHVRKQRIPEDYLLNEIQEKKPAARRRTNNHAGWIVESANV